MRALGPSGTATTTLVDGAGLSGTAAAARPVGTADLSGTATVDLAALGPWFARDKRTSARILLGDTLEDVTGLIGDVEISEDTTTLVRTAQFTLVDPRACFYDAASLVRGGQPVEVWLTCADYNSASPFLFFTGRTEACSNEDPYIPRATIRAASLASDLADATSGCIRRDPAGGGAVGNTRAELLEEYAISAGVGLSVPLPSAVVNKGIDISGVSVQELLLRWSALEGWYPRETPDGNIEILTEAEVIGAPARVVLAESDYLSVREDPPNRPVTSWTAGGTKLTDALTAFTPPETLTTLEYGINGDGAGWRRETEVTTFNGVETYREVRNFLDRPYLGTIAYTSTMKLVSRETVTNTYATVTWEYRTLRPEVIAVFAASGIDVTLMAPDTWRPGWYTSVTKLVPTTQLLRTERVVEGLFSPLSDTGDDLWTDGSHHREAVESWYETARYVTEYNYGTSCTLIGKTDSESVWVYPLSAIGALYDDGAYRLSPQYTMRVVSETAYSDSMFNADGSYKDDGRITRTLTETVRNYGWFVSAVTGGKPTSSWGEISTATVERSAVRGQTTVTQITTVSSRDGTSSYKRETVTGPLPDPVVASADIPQFGTMPMLATVESSPEYPLVKEQETNEDAESMAELIRVAKRHLRDSLGLRVIVVAAALPLIRVWDTVEVQDAIRNLTGKTGWVERLTTRVSVLNGWFGQELTVLIPPEDLP